MEIFIFSVFIIGIVLILFIDLFLINRKSHTLSYKEALGWSAVWISLALGFYLFLFFKGESVHGVENLSRMQLIISSYMPYCNISGLSYEEALDIFRSNIAASYLTGYIIEETLSVDNLFVILMILTSFSVNEKYYKKVLFWGILGAIILRFSFIFLGSFLIQKFDWILYVFGLVLIFSGGRMLFQKQEGKKIEPQNHFIVRFLSKRANLFPRIVGSRFFFIRNRKLFLTPLFLVLLLVEFVDLIFAFDSIPAVFSVTKDPYIVFFSNVFAILGLRSMFFLLVRIIKSFYYLKLGITVLLLFVGLKLILHGWLDQIGYRPYYSLYFILFVLTASIAASLIRKKVRS
ncbi:MAG: TerC/Alx family metal homeostasis membrane protein [Bacteroidetes bacterium]|nr:TerC/Alx family metal homeostasis membrane protein [Bacteroidota bacterium]